MDVIKTAIEGVVIIEPKVFVDSRGYFFESFSQRDFEEKVGRINFVQDNESMSSFGVVRAFGFQKLPYSQSKLVRCVKGKILDVALDVRVGSPTFGKHVAVELSDENHVMLFLPRGMAHGFSVLSENAVVLFSCDNYYTPQAECSFAWDDPNLNIDWRVSQKDIIVSEKDKHNPLLTEIESGFIYGMNC